MRILIAEDDHASRVYLLNILSAYGNCDITINGIEALDAYFMAIDESQPYDLICLDIMMPKVDGIKVYKTIRKSEHERKIGQKNISKIIMTTALTDSTKVFDEDSACEVYLTKPILADKLRNAVESFGFTSVNKTQ